MSRRVKYCNCGQVNAEHDSFCSCGQPILDVAAVATESPKPETKDESEPSASAGKKICPVCRTTNEFFALLCGGVGCGNDLSAVEPSGCTSPVEDVPAQSAAPAPSSPSSPGLLLSVGAQSFECRDGDIIGREGSVGSQAFAGIGTVSRQHVSFTLRDGQWFVTVLLGVRNITQLDGRELPRSTPQLLTGQHTLRMSTQCEVKLKVAGGR